jgi:hypothetical protein
VIHNLRQEIEMSKEKWVCHVTGADDVIECKNELDALRTANENNKAAVRLLSKVKDDELKYYPHVYAIAKDANKETV